MKSAKDMAMAALKDLPKDMLKGELIDKVGEAIGIPLGTLFDLRDAKELVRDLGKYFAKNPNPKLLTPDGREIDLDSPMKFGKDTDLNNTGGLSGGKSKPTKSYDEQLSTVVDADGRKLVAGKEKVYRGTDKEVADAKSRIDLHRAKKKEEAELNANGKKINPNTYTGGNYGYLEGKIENIGAGIDKKALDVDNKFWRSGSLVKETKEMTKKRQDAQLFNHKKAPNQQGKLTERDLDAEYQMLHQLALDLGAVKNGKYPEITGTLKIVSENPYCASCYGVINQFQDMFPEIKLILIDATKQQ
jgi:hypothetical protein